MPHLTRAQEVLNFLSSRNIQLSKELTRCDGKQLMINKKLRSLRNKLLPFKEKLMEEEKLASITQSYVLTKLGYGAGQEMADRFLFEYLRKFNDYDISFIYTTNPETNHSHILILIASGELPDFDMFNKPEKHQSTLYAFMEVQKKGCILVDPFTNRCGHASEHMEILRYNQDNNIHDILTTHSFLSNASAIMSRLPEVVPEANKIIQPLQTEELKFYLKKCAKRVGLDEIDWIYHSKNKAYYLPYKTANSDKINSLIALFRSGDLGKPQQLSSTSEKLFLALPEASLILPKLQQAVDEHSMPPQHVLNLLLPNLGAPPSRP